MGKLTNIKSLFLSEMTVKIQIFKSQEGCNSRAGGRNRKSPFTHLRTHSENNQLIIIWMASCTSGLTHILTILRKIAQQHEVQDKTNKYKLTKKGSEISDQMV